MLPNNSSVDFLEPPTTLTETKTEVEDLLEPPIDTLEDKAERLKLRLSRCNKAWIMRPTLETRGWAFAHYKCGHRLLCMSCGNEYAVRIASGINSKIRSRRIRGDAKLILFEIPNEAEASEFVNGLSKNNYHRSPTAHKEYLIIDPSEYPNEKLQQFKNKYTHQYLTSVDKLDWGVITKTISGRRPSGKLATKPVNNAGKTKISSRIVQTNAPISVLEAATKTVELKTRHLLPTDVKTLESAVVELTNLISIEILECSIKTDNSWYATVGTINAFVDLESLDWTIKESIN